MTNLTTPIQREWFEYINLCDQEAEICRRLDNQDEFITFFEVKILEDKLWHIYSLLKQYEN